MGCQGIVRILIERIDTLRPQWIVTLADNLAERKSTGLSVVFGDAQGEQRGTHLTSELGPLPAEAQVFHETVRPPPSLTIFGAGDDAIPLVRMAKQVGWHVRVFDARPAFATRMRFEEADEVMVTPGESLDQHVPLPPDSMVVVMTHRFAEDVTILGRLAERPPAYLGVLGPRKRTDRLLAELSKKGITVAPRAMKRFYAPVGLDLGASTPEAIAVSIVAEIQCLLSGRQPGHLRDRRAPIHG